MPTLANQSQITGVLIASYRRPAELRLAIEAALAQVQPISCVVVVDASPEPEKSEIVEICKAKVGVPIHFLDSPIPSSTIQRNIGAKALLALGVTRVLVLDDDTAPAPDYLSRLSKILDDFPDAIGASGVTFPPPPARTRLQTLKKTVFEVLGLESRTPGVISKAVCGIPVNRDKPEPVMTEWLFGCSLWRARVFDEVEYNPRLRGAALAEDLHFSLQASRFGTLWVDPLAQLHHSYSQVSRPDSALFAYRFARNRWFIIPDLPNPLLSRFFYFLSNAALASFAVLACICTLNLERGKEAVAYVKGTVDAIRDAAPR